MAEREGRATAPHQLQEGGRRVVGGSDLLKRVAGQSENALTCYFRCAVRDLNPEPAD